VKNHYSFAKGSPEKGCLAAFSKTGGSCSVGTTAKLIGNSVLFALRPQHPINRVRRSPRGFVIMPDLHLTQ
jgi:hypothetical protein